MAALGWFRGRVYLQNVNDEALTMGQKKIPNPSSLTYYVYTLSRPDGRVFYVGKGCGRRVEEHEKEAKKECSCHKCKVIRKIWRDGGDVKRSIVFETNDELRAYQYERDLIARIGLMNLTNVLPGGSLSDPPRRCSDKPMSEWTDRDYYDYLRNQYGMTPERLQAAMYKWREQRLEKVATQIKRATFNYRMNGRGTLEEIAHLEEEEERLRIALGLIRQERFRGF